MTRPNRTSRADTVLGLSAAVAMIRHALITGALLLALALVVFCGVAWLYARAQTSANEREVITTWVEASALSDGLSLPDHVVHYVLDGTPYQVDANTFAHDEQVIAIRDAAWLRIKSRFGWIALFAAVVALVGGYVLGRIGGKIRRDARLRGGWIKSPRKLRSLLRRAGPLSLLQIGPIRLLRETECQHILVEGTPGTGKSVALDHLLASVGRAWPIVMYDTKGEFVERLFADGDVILNPMDKRCPAWTPWDEITVPTDAARIAKALVAPQGPGDSFWIESARGLLADVLVSMPVERRTNGELCRMLMLAGTEELQALLTGTSSGRLFNDPAAERQRESVRNTLLASVRGLQLLQPDARAGEGFSMVGWVRAAAERTGTAGRVFLSCPPDHAPAITPIIAAWIESAAAAILGLGQSRTRRLLFAVDELPTLPPLEFLQRLAAEGRGYGACVIAAVQSQAQLRVRYGDDGAAAFCAQFSTRLVFRAADADSAEQASRLLGEEELDVANETEGAASRTNHSLSGDVKTRRLVTPTEVLQLPNLRCFLRVPGPFPIVKLKLKPRRAPKVAPPYVPHDPTQLVHRPVAASPKPKPPAVDDGGPL
jgi:type IV conjugative transfer system coupling protein TraD